MNFKEAFEYVSENGVDFNKNMAVLGAGYDAENNKFYVTSLVYGDETRKSDNAPFVAVYSIMETFSKVFGIECYEGQGGFTFDELKSEVDEDDIKIFETIDFKVYENINIFPPYDNIIYCLQGIYPELPEVKFLGGTEKFEKEAIKLIAK